MTGTNKGEPYHDAAIEAVDGPPGERYAVVVFVIAAISPLGVVDAEWDVTAG